MRVWFLLSALLFLTRCADQIRPYWKSIVGAKDQPTQGAVAAAPRGIRLASWNLEWLDQPGRGPKPRSRADYARLAEYAQRLDADVIAVQEVASDLALALVFPPEHYAYHLAARGGSQRSGFVFKRGLPVVPHPDLDGLAIHHLRAGADLGVRLGDQELRLLSVHLKAFCVSEPLSSLDRDCQHLKAQLPALEAWVDERAREGAAFVVVGDFNRSLTSSSDELWTELNDGDPKGLNLLQATPGRKARCSSDARHDALDHVLLGGAATGWLGAGSFSELVYAGSDAVRGLKLSDHCPLAISLVTPES
jgi:endonuclease/exonuclease/phosphatase family metal-dependent hydrolase